MPPPKRHLSVQNEETTPDGNSDAEPVPTTNVPESRSTGSPEPPSATEPADPGVYKSVREVVPPQQYLQVEGIDPDKKEEKEEQQQKEVQELPPPAPAGDYKMLLYQPLKFRYAGKYPFMAVNNRNQVVVVFHHNVVINDMYYSVGQYNPANGRILWGEEHWYDMGSYPRIAINDSGLVVEVHESPRKRKTWYHVGMIHDDRIDWGPSYEIGQGLHPAVALSNDDQIVIVEESGGRFFSPEGYYFFGKVNKIDKTILFSRKRELLVHSAREPSVTMKGKNIVVAFLHERNRKLHIMLGRMDGLVVAWAEYEFLHFAVGTWPSVSLNENGVLVVCCQTHNRQVLCREGELRENDGMCHVQWSERAARQYEHGVYPTICLLEDNTLVEMHGASKFNGHAVYYATGKIKK